MIKKSKNYRGKKCKTCDVNISTGSKSGFCRKHSPKKEMSEYTKNKIRISKTGSNNPMYGKRLSDETKKKIANKLSGDKNHSWVGDNVGYSGIHMWISRNRLKPDSCQFCGSSGCRIEWANVSREYKRDFEDWIALCKKCHVKYDDTINKSWKTRKSYDPT